MSTTGSPVLAVHDVDFSYGRLQVLFGVSLEVGRGEAVALLGTNGAGKSTLLRVVSGLEQPSRGSVVLDGRDVSARSAEDRVRDGLVLVPGGKAVFADLTVAENLEMKAFTLRRSSRAVREAVQRAYGLFPRLAERRDQRAGTMSGGEQQQLALAKAVILEPKVLCIDELSLGLAPTVVEALLDSVRAIRATGVSLVVVEQSLNVAAAICERAVFMEKGEIRFEGRTAQLLERDDLARAVFLGAPPAAKTTPRPRPRKQAAAPPRKPPAKRTPAKKAAAKKTPAKRTPAKRTPAKTTPAKKAAAAKKRG
ncbi:MAG TPA: ABC transporter ATP-binding protein [Mycobacteriales bacterium]|nr:ABC transporter ATP-binding protein [Mycobacteriales bacterium]